MNRVVLMGRLTRDPDIRYSQGENSTAIARYTLAVDRRFKRDGEQTADFISCVALGKRAEIAEKYFRQGTKVVIEGRIQTGSYTNREGIKIHTTEVFVENQEFAESKAASQNQAPNQYQQNTQYQQPQQAPQPNYQQQPNNVQPQQNSGYMNGYPAPSADPGDGFMNIPEGLEEELPFN